jgi:dihydroorotate dehydrogenase
MYPLLRPLLFRLDPERAHSLTLGFLRSAARLPPLRAVLRASFMGPEKPVEAFGLNFSNPVGLAAGYDKDGLGWPGLALLGFGHIELGTVTPQPQPGNPKPRIFRLTEEGALINRMGFPSKGADWVARQLSHPRPAGPVLGMNLGMNKDTPVEEAAGDYLGLLLKFAPLVDYLAINVSSPNTAGLRRLQARTNLEALLSALEKERDQFEASSGRRVPLLVKLAPDLSEAELQDALEAILRTGMDGVIATNTTVSRPGRISASTAGAGGLSGEPLRDLSTQMVKRIYSLTGGQLPVVGVGGILTAAGAREKLEAGAVLIQIYTGLVYSGPGLVKDILLDLQR